MLDCHVSLNLNCVTKERKGIKSVNESYCRKHVVSTLRAHSGICESTFIIKPVTLQESWHGRFGGWAVCVAANFSSISLSISWVITVAFDGLLTTAPSFLWDTVHVSCRKMWQHFWHQFPPLISGTCHHWWPQRCSLNRMCMASGVSCTRSASVGWRWVTDPWLLRGVGIWVWVWGQTLWEKNEQKFMYYILKCLSVKMCVDYIYDV